MMREMKTLILIGSMVAGLLVPAMGISPKRIESAKERAAADHKLIAFVVLQDFYNPHCPKCVAEVTANNNKINHLTPHKGVIVIKLEKTDLKPDDVPDVVLKAAGLPRIVITNAEGSQVIDVINAKADKKRAQEMEEKIAAALGATA